MQFTRMMQVYKRQKKYLHNLKKNLCSMESYRANIHLRLNGSGLATIPSSSCPKEQNSAGKIKVRDEINVQLK